MGLSRIRCCARSVRHPAQGRRVRARLDQPGQRLSVGFRDLPVPERAPQQRRNGQQGDSVSRLDRAADLGVSQTGI